MFYIKILLCFILSFPIHSEVIRITNGEWQPYLSEYSYENGLASHIVREAFKAEGIDVEWGFFPWKRSYELAKVGEDWDASAVWWPTDEAKEDFLISVPVVETSNVFFHLKSFDFKWDKMEDIIGLKVGMTVGYHYGDDFMKLLSEKKLTVENAGADEANFKKLLAKRIKIFPNDPIVGYAQLRDMYPPEILLKFTHNPKKFQISTLNLIISKKIEKRKYFLKKFNSGYKKLEESGKIKEMYSNLEKGVYDKKKNIWIRR